MAATKRFAIRLVMALFMIGIIRGVYGLVIRSRPYSAESLRAASEAINKMLPAYIGTEMQLVHTSVNAGRFVYEFRLVNVRATAEALQTPVNREEIRKAACAEKQAREFLSHDVRLLYRIAAADGRPLAAIEITGADCGL